MKRVTLNFVVDSIGLVNLLLLAVTGTILRWVLPSGSGGHGRGFRGGRPGGEAGEWLGLRRHNWGDVHFVLATLFICVILLHIVLHWTWIKTCGKSILFPSHKVHCDPADEPETE